MNSTLSQQQQGEALAVGMSSNGAEKCGTSGLASVSGAVSTAVTASASSSSLSGSSTTASSSSSSVIIEVPTSSRDLFSSTSNPLSLKHQEAAAERASLSVNNCQQQRDRVEVGCSRTSALFSTGASTGYNSNCRTDDSEPSTSARCQYTPQSKAMGGMRQVHHASAQTNDRYLSRNSTSRASSPAVAIVNIAAAGGVGNGPGITVAPVGSLRSRRRAEAVAAAANLPRNSTSEEMLAAIKVVVAEAVAAVEDAERADFHEDDAWADCEETTSSDLEEICTCPHRSESESSHSSNTTLNEDEFETTANVSTMYRDVLELHGYLPSADDNSYVDAAISDIGTTPTIPLASSSAPVFPLQQRKRKYNDGRVMDGDYCGSISGSCSMSNLDNVTHGGVNLAVSDVNSRKRIAYDITSTPRSSYSNSAALVHTSPSTSQMTVSPFGSPIGGRTPRSVIPTRENPPPELQNWLTQFQRWTHAERLLAVDRLIEHCEPTQVRHMMKVIEPKFQRDFISLLPRELALQVLAYLDPKDLLRAAQTCRSWRFLCDDNLLWKEKCRKAQIQTERIYDRPKRGRAGNMPPIASPWKAAYMRQHVIEMNWRSRPIREPKVLKGHDEHVITCLQFCDNRIVSGSDDNTLKVWSAVTGRCLRTLVGHTGGVWSSQMSGNVIISGSTDRTLKVWNMETGMCVHTLMGHTSTVRCMHLHGKKVVSGSRDATLRVWDIEQGSCLHVLVGHLAAVRCVQYDGKLIVSGAYDYMVKIWHPERQECLHTLQGHTNRVYSLQFDGIHVVSGSLDTSIRVWDVETGNCKHTLMGHQSLTSGMELRQNILVSGNADSTVKVWDITTGQCLQTLSGPNKHQSAVTCLQFNSRFVVTSSDDGTVKLWDVKTGEFIRNLVTLESGGSGGVVWRIRANDTKLICAVGSRNGTEETKLLVLDFDVEGACVKCS